MAAPPTPPTTAPTGPPTTAPPTAPATPPVTAPLWAASAAEEEAQISVAVAAASIHRDIKTSIGIWRKLPMLSARSAVPAHQLPGGLKGSSPFPNRHTSDGLRPGALWRPRALA